MFIQRTVFAFGLISASCVSSKGIEFVCDVDDDCPSGNKCVEDICRKSSYCLSASDCEADETCVVEEQRCKKIGQQEGICRNDGDCAGGEERKCIDGKCVQVGLEGGPCENDGDCPLGHECEEGLCECQKEQEKCNGRDDDCDGEIDEGFGVGEACLGECGSGVYECRSLGSELVCSTDRVGSEYNPKDEICDGIDNDCDGQIDDDLDRYRETCGVGICEHSMLVGCVEGREVTCEPGTPEDDVCDNLDNDCDGEADNDPDFAVKFEGETVTALCIGEKIMWQKGSADIWASKAVEHCANLVLAGYDDWVVPKVEDYYAILDECGPTEYYEPGIYSRCKSCSRSTNCNMMFPDDTGYYLADRGKLDVSVDFGSGDVTYSTGQVRCVRYF